MLLCIASVVVSSGQGTQPHTHAHGVWRAGGCTSTAYQTVGDWTRRDATCPTRNADRSMLAFVASCRLCSLAHAAMRLGLAHRHRTAC